MRHPLTFAVVFLTTLQSYYFYQIHLSPGPVLAFLLLFVGCLANRIEYGRDEIIIMVILMAGFMANIVCGVLLQGGDLYVPSLFGIILGPLYFLLIVSLYRNRWQKLKRAMRAVLAIHVAVFYLQTAVYYTTGNYIDMLAPVTGEEQRIAGYASMVGLIRPAGLFNEPGTYSIFIVMLVFLINRFREKLTTLEMIALSSAVASFSLTGIGLAAAFLTIYILTRPGYLLRSLAILTPIAGLVAYIAGEFLWTYLTTRLENLDEDGSFNSRFASTFTKLDHLSEVEQVFGLGIGQLGDLIAYDSTYAFFSIHLGIVFTFLLIAPLVLYLKLNGTRLPALIFLAGLFSGTLQITYLPFWLLIGALAVGTRKERKHPPLLAKPPALLEYTPIVARDASEDTRIQEPAPLRT